MADKLNDLMRREERSTFRFHLAARKDAIHFRRHH
jgi:hypothetical protein